MVITAHDSVPNAVEAMKSGATDFLLKPFSLDHLTAVVHKALEVRALRDENRDLKEELHVRSDRLAVAYRRWLKELGVTYGTFGD